MVTQPKSESRKVVILFWKITRPIPLSMYFMQLLIALCVVMVILMTDITKICCYRKELCTKLGL